MQSGPETNRQPIPARPGAPVPRWRFVKCVGQNPSRVARSTVQRLREPGAWLPAWGMPRHTSCAFLPSGLHVLTATASSPVGTALTRAFAAPAVDTGWVNAADIALLARGYSPVVLRLLKQAAVQACSATSRRLSSFTLTPLPHLPGELLVRHSTGWIGRARAWEQEGYLLALVWQC